MSDVLVRLRGTPDRVLNKLVESGIFETKSEAIRVGIITLGKELGLLTEEDLVARKLEHLEKKRKSGELKTISWKKIKKGERHR